MTNKIYESFEESVADVFIGATIMVGTFVGPGGFPYFLIKALAKQGANNLTIIAVTSGNIGSTLFFDDIGVLFKQNKVRKIITTFPISTSPSRPTEAEKQILAGEVELELVPLGTLAERIRAGGAGIPAFFTPTGAGTIAERGKEKRRFIGREYLLEHALKADYAFVRAYKADKLGNLIYRGTQRHINPVMAQAAKVTIAEVDEIAETGELDPENIHTPGIFVKRIIKVKEDPGFPRHVERNFKRA
jgi:3-oxoacid CoA-transferase A subunit